MTGKGVDGSRAKAKGTNVLGKNAMAGAPRMRSTAPRPRQKSARIPRTGGRRAGVGIAVAAVAIGLVALGLLRAHVQSPAVTSGAAQEAAGTESPKALLGNLPPEINDARLVPSSPDARSRIAVTVDASDPDGDAIRYDVSWFRNGMRVQAPPLQVFPAGVARRGDRIRAEIVATDGFHRTAPYRTADVRVKNLLPVASGVELTPLPLVAGQAVEAKPVASDPDGDAIRWRFRWKKNGETVMGQRGVRLPGHLLERGDRIRVTATPWDFAGPGASVQSAESIVGNRSPRIVSSPPATVGDGSLKYTLRAEDPDGDPVRFALKGEVPEGLTLSEKGVLLGDLGTIAPGRYDVEIVASDPAGGTDIQSMTITVPERAGTAAGEAP